MQESFFIDHEGSRYLLSRRASNGWYIRGSKKDFNICTARVDVESAKSQARAWLEINSTKVK